MSAVASVLAIVLFLAFVSAGLQKVSFNPLVSATASHLGFTKRAYQRIGIVEIVAAVGLLVGLTAKGASFWAVLNELAAAGLVVLMAMAVSIHLRKGDNAKNFAPAFSLGVLALLELILRWVA